MQQFCLLALVAAAVLPGEAGRLERQMGMDSQLLAESGVQEKQAAHEKEGVLAKEKVITKELDDMKKQNTDLEEMVTEEEKTKKQELQAEVLADKAKLAASKTQNDDLVAKEAVASKEVAATESEIAELRKKVVSEQRAFLKAHSDVAAEAEAITPKVEVSALQNPGQVVMDKKPAAAGVPEQGFEGQAVAHKDMETITGDWGAEYGAEMKGKVAPKQSCAMAAAVGLFLLIQ